MSWNKKIVITLFYGFFFFLPNFDGYFTKMTIFHQTKFNYFIP